MIPINGSILTWEMKSDDYEPDEHDIVVIFVDKAGNEDKWEDNIDTYRVKEPSNLAIAILLILIVWVVWLIIWPKVDDTDRGGG